MQLVEKSVEDRNFVVLTPYADTSVLIADFFLGVLINMSMFFC